MLYMRLPLRWNVKNLFDYDNITTRLHYWLHVSMYFALLFFFTRWSFFECWVVGGLWEMILLLIEKALVHISMYIEPA